LNIELKLGEEQEGVP